MPIKKDGSGKRWVEMEFLVPGTPEQVWQAMATGPGNAAWFTTADIEERVGGKLEFDFGSDMKSSGEVTIWEPPHRFGYVEREWNGDAPPVDTEIVIEPRSGDQSFVRMVHTLVSPSDEWDGQMESFESGWPAFFGILRIYLKHFAGEQAASFQVMATLKGEHLDIWLRLTKALGLAGVNAGEHCTTAAQPEALSGIVESIRQDETLRMITLRLETPMPGVALIATHRYGDSICTSASIFYYGENAAEQAAKSEALWRDWLKQTFPGDD